MAEWLWPCRGGNCTVQLCRRAPSRPVHCLSVAFTQLVSLQSRFGSGGNKDRLRTGCLVCRPILRGGGKVTTSGYCKLQRRQLGASGAFVQFSLRTRASRQDGPESNSDKKEEDDIPEIGDEKKVFQDELEGELKNQMEKADEDRTKLKKEATKNSWFWERWLSSWVQNDSRVGEEKGDELEQGVVAMEEDVQDGKNRERKNYSEKQVAKSQEPQEEIGEGERHEDTVPSDKTVQNDEAKVGFWRRFCKQEEILDEDPLSPEEIMLLQDLENLTFQWKDLFNPTVENVLALALTALLVLALVKIFWQLGAVVVTIFLAALKYSVLATFLVGLLIFLL